MITVIDFEGFSLFGGETRFNRALGQSSEMSALYYPQARAHAQLDPPVISPAINWIRLDH